jgi:hypothetical protein
MITLELRQLVETITKEILQNLPNSRLDAGEKSKKVLFVFCDSHAHEAYSDTFIELQQAGISHDALFLDGETSGWLGIGRIECGGACNVIAMDVNAPAPLEVPLQYDAIIIPEIDLDNAARISLGMKGTVKAEIVFSALMLDKPVIIGGEGPGLKRADRQTLKILKMPEPYRRRFTACMEDLEELGIIIQKQTALVAPLIEKWGKERTAKKSVNAAPSNAASVSGYETIYEGKLLTEQWVKAEIPSAIQILRVSKRTIITPLARDALRQRAVAVEILK